jgi:NADP-dependent 3-hydroxy acid dehydrogenase YdfG
MQAKGIQAAAALVNGMSMIIPIVGATSPLGQAIAKSMMDIGKHIPPGAVSPEAQENQLKQMMQKAQQMRPQMAAMQGQGQPPPPGAGAAPPQPPPGA